MFPIDTADAGAQPPAVPPAGVPGHFQDRNFPAGTEATIVPAWLMEMLVQEGLGVVALAGLAPDKNNNRQQAAAIQALLAAESQARQVTDNFVLQQFADLFGAAGTANDITNASLLLNGVQYFGRQMGGANLGILSASGAISPNQLGVIYLNPDGGQLTATLPPANCFKSINANPRLKLVRLGGSGNQAFVQCAGADVFAEAADSNGNTINYTDLLPGESLELIGDYVTGGWHAIRVSRGRLRRFSGTVGTALTPWSCQVPIGVRTADIWLVGGGATGGCGDGTNPGGGGGAAGGIYKQMPVTQGATIGGQVAFGAPPASGGIGNSGGTTNMTGTALYATGGNGGKPGSSYPSNAGGLGGIGSGGDENVTGQSGGDGGSGFSGSGYGGQPPTFALGTGGRAAANAGGGQQAADNAGTNGGGSGGTYGSNPGPTGYGGPGLSQVNFP